MKKLIYILAWISIILISCKKDFLNIVPESTVTTDILYKTDKDYKDALTGCYTPLRSQFNSMYIFGDVRSDDSWHALGNNVTMVSIDNFAERSSEGVFASTWRNYYQVISYANLLLSKIADADESVVVNKQKYIAEARFLRAFAYFDLVRIFGDVPIITTPISVEDSYETGRGSVDNVYNEVIIPDLLAAESGLPAAYTGEDVGRATKGAAKALLGKVYLYQKDFVKAEAKLLEVTGMGYALLPNYLDLFDYTKDEHHSEYIFDIEYIGGGLGLGSIFTNSFIPKSNGDFAEYYFGIKGGAGELNSPTFDLFNAFDPNDPRRNITVDTAWKFYRFIQIETVTLKYVTPVASINDSPANWKVIRYADVLLMLSEALNENNKTDEALTYLNQVRARVGMPVYSGLTKDEARAKIYLERRFELGMEGHRWFDLVRTGRAMDVMNALGITMKSYNTVFPLPLREIQVINDPNVFPQNPGYD